MDLERLLHDLVDRHTGVEGGIRILENHLDGRAVGAHFRSTQLVQVHGLFRIVVENLSRDLHTVIHGMEDVDDGASDRALAAARLADQTQGLAFEEIEAHSVDRLHLGNLTQKDPAENGKADPQIFDLENLLHQGGSSSIR
jgi:hypothetical protein